MKRVLNQIKEFQSSRPVYFNTVLTSYEVNFTSYLIKSVSNSMEQTVSRTFVYAFVYQGRNKKGHWIQLN